MPLERVSNLVRRAREGGYALGYFESWNLESLQGVVDAAELAAAPVVLGFNGEFLSRHGRLAPERLALFAALGKAAAGAASVPCALLFNECSNDVWLRQAIRAGFNCVMPTPGESSLAAYERRLDSLVSEAHALGVDVEAELGELPYGGGGSDQAQAVLTDPDGAAAFVAATGIDLLAVSVGNVHVLTQGDRGLDLARLEAISSRVQVPLVLHGGTGIAPDALRAAIALGVAKVNFGTYVKQRYLRATRLAFQNEQADPHRLLGLGGPEDILVAGRLAVRDAVLERIDWLGCRGKAARVVVEVRMPEVATVSDTVKILRWLAEEGQTIERGQALVEVETDKATVVVESAHRGTLRTIVHKVGDDVPTGQVIATFETEGRTGGGTLEDRPATTATPVPDEPAPAASEPATRGAGSFFARNRQADRPALTEPQSEGRPNSPGGPLPG